MNITPVRFSNVLPLKIGLVKEKEVKNNKTKNMTSFPIGYGQTNIAFCGKRKKQIRKKPIVTMEEMLNKCKSTGSPLPLLHPLPILQKYKPLLFSTMQVLSSEGKCLVYSEKEIDSKEIFIENLRSLIDTDRLKKLGFERGKPFVYINLSDYLEDPKKAVVEINKEINRNIKPSQKPILLVDGVRNFFANIESSYDFGNNSIFNKYPTIFFAEEGFNLLKADEAKNFRFGFMTDEQIEKETGSCYSFNKFEFEKTKSKIAFINNISQLKLESLSGAEVFEYLSDPWVQKHLITRGYDVKIPEETLLFTMALAKATKYTKADYYNENGRNRLLTDDASPLNFVLQYLRNGFSNKMIKNPDAKMIEIFDVVDALPVGTNWFNIISGFAEVQEKYNEANGKNPDIIVKTKTTKRNKTDKTNKKDESKDVDKPSEKDNTEKVDENKKENVNFEVVQKVKTRFSDVGGMYNLKKQLKNEFVDILRNPKVKNSQKPSGILLAGPPGCGKTLLARAIAGEAGVPFISTAGSSFVEVYVGTGAKRVRELYTAAREEAKKHPSKTAIVFIDEFDSVGGSRKNGTSSEDTRTIAALLHEMDGSGNKDENDIKVITIVATNYKNMLDSALVRSGRIDLKYQIDDPRYSVKAREEILKIHSKELTFKNEKEKQTILKALAQTTSGLSGADLAELLKKANRMSLSVERDKNFVTADDITEAKMQVQAGVKTDMEHTPYELKQTISHEAGHAICSLFMEKVFEGEENKHKMPLRVLDFITNSARGSALGATYFKPSLENKMGSKESCLADLVSIYGGYAIESELFDTHSSGISKDLSYATEIIENAVSQYDFGSQKHYLALNSELTKSLFQEEIKNDILKFAQKGMDISRQIIKFARPFIEAYVSSLLENGADLDKVITSAEFKSKFEKWLKKNKKSSDYKLLCESIKAEVSEFCDEKGRNKNKLGF